MAFLKKNLFWLSVAVFFAVGSGTLYGQVLSVDLGAESGSSAHRVIQLFVLMTVLSLAPSILMMVTSFTRIVIVLSFLRNAVGLQQSPPNAILASLALFMTFFIMSPVFEKAYDEGLSPYFQEKITDEEAFSKATKPFHTFMLQNVGEKELRFFFDLSKTVAPEKPEDTPLKLLVPAFMISELKRAFEIGFLIFLPFLIIDMTVASILMSMGMMMLPPMMISLPFKLIFFVLIDGWQMIVGSLAKGYGL